MKLNLISSKYQVFGPKIMSLIAVKDSGFYIVTIPNCNFIQIKFNLVTFYQDFDETSNNIFFCLNQAYFTVVQ